MSPLPNGEVHTCAALETRYGLAPGACARWLRAGMDEATFVQVCAQALQHAEQLGADPARVAPWFFGVPQPELGGCCLAEAIAEGRLRAVRDYLSTLAAGAVG